MTMCFVCLGSTNNNNNNKTITRAIIGEKAIANEFLVEIAAVSMHARSAVFIFKCYANICACAFSVLTSGTAAARQAGAKALCCRQLLRICYLALYYPYVL